MMKKLEQNVVKGWITTVIGTITMLLTLFLVFTGEFDFVWEGIGGLAIGTILLLAPKTIEKKVSEAIKAWGGRDSGSATTQTEVPPTVEKQSD